MKKNTLNKIFLVVGVAFFFLGLWQLDICCCPKIDWARTVKGEILPFWFMYEADAYVLWYSLVIAGFFVALASLWFWCE